MKKTFNQKVKSLSVLAFVLMLTLSLTAVSVFAASSQSTKTTVAQSTSVEPPIVYVEDPGGGTCVHNYSSSCSGVFAKVVNMQYSSTYYYYTLYTCTKCGLVKQGPGYHACYGCANGVWHNLCPY